MSGSPDEPPRGMPSPAARPLGLDEAPAAPVPKPAAPLPPPFPVPPLFGKYPFEGVTVADPGLAPYLYLHPVYTPHSEGRLSGRPFMKGHMHLVERLANHLMKGGKFTGKKSKAIRVLREAFDELAKKTQENPIQLLVRAVEHAAPREEVTRLQFGGISVPRAVDAAPARRVHVAIRNIAQGAINASHKSTRSIASCLATEIAAAAKGDMTSFAVGRKEEVERVAQSAR
jgi:small subunit ribosomal protein S7